MKTESSPWKWSLLLRFHLWLAKRRRRLVLEIPWQDFAEFELFPAAEVVIKEFFGLRLPALGGGSVEINPVLAVGLKDHMDELSASHGVAFFPLGEIDGGDAWLLIDEKGRLYSWFGSLLQMGEYFDDGLKRIVHGKRYHGVNYSGVA